MRAPRRGQVDVELVEAAGAVTPPAEPGADWRRLLRRIPRRAWAAVAGAVVLALVVGGGVQWRADRAQASRLARTAGLTVSLSAPLSEVWRAPREGVVGVVGDVLVLEGREGSGVLAVGLDDGATRWERSSEGAFGCALVRRDGGTGPDRWLVPVNVLPAGSAVLACIDDIPFGDDAFPGNLTATALPQSEVSVIDPASGAVERRIILPGSGGPTQIDDGIATMGLDGEDRLVASRWSLLTGELVWEYTGPRVDRVAGASFTSDSETMTWESGELSVTLDSRTGEAIDLASSERPRELLRLTLPDGGTATASLIGEERVELVVADGDGTRRFTTAGVPLDPLVDDGTAPRTLLIQPAGQEGVLAIDARTGDELWSRPAWASPVVLAGRVVLLTDGELTSVDAETGGVVWTHDDPALQPGGGLPTDGRVVLTQERVDGRTFLVARDVASGDQVWRTPSPLDQGTLQPLPDGRVLLSGSGQTVLLGH